MPATYTSLSYHIVFSTKGRQRWISPSLRGEVYAYVSGVVENIHGVVYAIGGVEDHIHLLVGIPASLSVSNAVRTIKANSSKWVNEKKQVLERFEWQEGYSAFTVSRSQVPKVQTYIRNQEEHHRKQTFHQEMEGLLSKHGVSFDSDSWK